LGYIADILQQRGQNDEALRIRREEELPVYERLGDVREMIVCRVMIAQYLIVIGKREDVPEARAHLQWALAEARRLQLPEVATIQEILSLINNE